MSAADRPPVPEDTSGEPIIAGILVTSSPPASDSATLPVPPDSHAAPAPKDTPPVLSDSPASPVPKASRLRAALAWLPFLLVTAFGLYLLWPVPTGVMPLSADHTVHLTRAYLYGQQLAGGHLVGWSPTWFFGFPLGELYPVLGDLGVLALRVLGLGYLDWPRAYAGMFTLVFLTQGWAMLRCGRALGWGPIPGLVAALLILADVGAYREGGWTYTVVYGVWPQALSTALAWLAFAELALAARTRQARPVTRPVPATSPTPTPQPVPSTSSTPAPQPVPAASSTPTPQPVHSTPSYSSQPAPSTGSPASQPVPPASSSAPPPAQPVPSTSRRHLVHAALATAGALLAHPMAIMMLALGAPLYLLAVGLRGPHRRAHLAEVALQLALALGIGAALAAWWLLPMTAHSAWMASYGWLHAPLADMLRMASHGQWTQLMPAAVGHAATLGLALAALFGRAPLRFFALWTLAHWLLASTDLFWTLRLDWIAGGFQHIQYQRFLIAAKPGFYLLAGAAVGGLVHLAVHTWSMRHVRKASRYLAPLPLLPALALAAWQARDVHAAISRHHVGHIQTERVPGRPAFAADYAAFLAWARDAWAARDADYRIAFRADRNLHWFMDSPVVTNTPSYKQGFTPGDNFVHKPESGEPALLRRLGVRYVVGAGRSPVAREAARFGEIYVAELPDPEPLAHLEGPGALTIEHPAIAGEGLRVRVADARDDTRLVLHIAGYPRWQLELEPAAGGPPGPVEWFEAPVLGDSPIATQAQRRAGELRGGKALGDDGREPTLIATAARDGVYTLRYDRWRRADIIGLGAALLGLLALLLLTRDAALARLRPWARRLTHPALLLALLALALALAVLRHQRGAAREHDLASARLRRGEADAVNTIAGPLKTDMIVYPAVLARPDRTGTSGATFKHVTLGPTLDGWYALDDDDAKQRRRGQHRLRLSARPVGATEWTPLTDLQILHRPDRRRLDDIAVPAHLQDTPVDLQLHITTTGDAPPKLGLDLTLQDAP